MSETRRPSFPAPRPKTTASFRPRCQLAAQGSRRLGITASNGRAGGIPTVVFSSQKLFVTVGGAAAFYSAALSCAPTHPVTVRPTNMPPGLRVSPSLHVFTRDDWRSPRVFRVAAPGSNLLDDHSGALTIRDPHRVQTVEHVSSSMDACFRSPRVLLVPPVVCVQVNSRLGCCVFTSGQAMGTNMRAGGAGQGALRASGPTTTTSKVAQSYHEFTEIELSVDDQAGRKTLVARSTVLVQQPPTLPAAKTTTCEPPRATSAASMAAMAAVEAANVATVKTAEMLERRRTRRSLLNPPVATSNAGCAVNTGGPIDGVAPSAATVTSVGFCAYSASGSLAHEATSNTIVKIASRAGHSVLLFKGGALLSLGKLLEHDHATSDPTSTINATMISLETGTGTDAALSRMLVDVACGDHHVVAITEQGYLLTWGDARDGRLGHGLSSHSITAVDGDVSNDGQINTAPASTKATASNIMAPAVVREPQVVRSLLHKRIVHVACGSRHSVALVEDGDVFSWGHGACGALGHGTFETVDAPKSVESLRGQRVACVACGDMHTAVVLASGTLLTCGWSEHGRLGRACNPVDLAVEASRAAAKPSSDYLGDDDANDRRSSSYSPSLLSVEIKASRHPDGDDGETERCTYVACGAAHTLLLTSSHRVLAFGWNMNGQLGVGDCRSRWTPTPVDYFEDGAYIVSALAAGKLHSLAALQDGRLFAWGSDELGQCGVGSFPQIYTIPHLVTSMVGLHVSQLAAADGHSVVLTLGAQRHLDALEASHPQRYAQLVDRFEVAVQEDAARRALVFARAREKQLQHEARARKRKPMGTVTLDGAATSSLLARTSAAVAMAGTNTSLAKVLVMQARVEQEVADFERAQASRLDTNGAALRRQRPHTASAALSSSSWVTTEQSDSRQTNTLATDSGGDVETDASFKSIGNESREGGKSDATDSNQGSCRPLLASRPRTAGTGRPVRCSSAALWRQSRLFSFHPTTTTPTANVAKTNAKRPATSAGGARTSTASRMSREARAQLGVLLDDSYDAAERSKTPSVSGESQSHEPGRERGSALLSVALAAMEQQQREAAWFPVSRPKSPRRERE